MTTARHRVLVSILALALSPLPAYANSYSAVRFDSTIRLLPNGTLQVVETVVFRFEEGTFSHVFREIPHRRTDGIEIVSAAMDDNPFQVGEGVGHIEISGRSRTRVTWRFAPAANSSHTFELTYIARGVVRQENGADLLAWRALPTDHAYRIASSTVSFVVPVPLQIDPEIELHRGERYAVDRESSVVRINAQAIGSNGWLEARLRFPPGSVIAAAPAWQERERQAAAAAPKWLIAAGFVFAVCLVLLFALRTSYDAPSLAGPAIFTSPDPPDALAPAVAGALVANGRARLEQAIATLLSLADRGEISISEQPRGRFGRRSFLLTRRPDSKPRAGYEQAVMELVFGAGDRRDSVALGKARSRLARRFRRFSREMDRELIATGLMDEARKAVRDRYLRVALALVAVAVLAALSLLAMMGQLGPWPMLVVLAFVLAAATAVIFFAGTTPLSNEGLRRASAWRGFRRYLKDLAHQRTPLANESAAMLLPLAIALGLAYPWSRYLKHQPGALPAWFRAVAADPGAFPAFVAAGASGHAGGGGAGGSAGGGASGAG
jgi:hypothetical protein